MILLEDKLISEDIFEQEFVCNLKKCKGACCVEGDSGAPLDKEETEILENIFDKVKPYLTPEGIASIEKQGKWEIDARDGDYVTPLIEGEACAYVTYDKNGITKCGIEKAYEDGVIDYQKPISCHLYPIRVKKYDSFTAMNYDEWPICSPACSLGKELKVSVYQFLKVPLIRKYGEDFYEQLSIAAEEWQKEFGKK